VEKSRPDRTGECARAKDLNGGDALREIARQFVVIK
jgi:hypothetical protein